MLRERSPAFSSSLIHPPGKDNMKHFLAFAFAFFLSVTTPLSAQDAASDPSLLTLDRIFSKRDFREESAGTMRWSHKGSYHFMFVPPAEGKEGRDLVKVDPETEAKTVLVSAQEMIPVGAEKPLEIDSFEFSKDESLMLIFTNSRKVWRHNTRGDYWVLNLETKKLTKLGGEGEPSTMMFAKFSPDTKKIAYVRMNNLYVQNLDDLTITALTDNGSDTLINGTSDWVNEEEFAQRDCFRWSPDGTKLAYWQFDTSGVKEFVMLNQTEGKYPELTRFPYPKAGEKNSAVKVGIVQVAGGETTWLKVPGEPRDFYLPWGEWTPDGQKFVVQQLNRLQNVLTVFAADPVSGEASVVLKETDDAWVDLNEKVEWLGNNFLWMSERSGWRHAYRANMKGELKPITTGEFDLIEIANIDQAGGWMYYMAAPENATQRYLFRVSLDGDESERLSPADQIGSHSYSLSPDAKWAVHTFSTVDKPPVVSLVQLPEHRVQRVMKEQKKLNETLAAVKMPKTEFIRVDIGNGIELDAYVVTPTDLDPEKKYPLLMHVYGEPAGQTVRDVWGGSRHLWHAMLAQKGIIVASVDTRGTNSPRGRAWRKCIYGKLGLINSQEEAEATKAIVKKYPFIDPAKVAIWGWSGGGSSSLDAIFRYPDVFNTAIAVAPVADRSLYDSIYEERYMGLPETNEEGYRDGSPLAHAGALKGNLMIIHGTGDDNVHYQGTEKLINELVKHNKMFTIMPYPNRDHSINSGAGTTRHLYHLMTEYLLEHLKGE